MITKGRLLSLVAVAMAALVFALPVSAQDTASREKDLITVDFVKKDIHTVMHFIALRSDLKVIVDGQVQVKLTVMFKDVLPVDAITSICKANQLDLVNDGGTYIIKRRASQTALANVVSSGNKNRYNVSFERQRLVEAIMEVAQITNTEASIPATAGRKSSAKMEGVEIEGDKDDAAEVVETIQKREISMFMVDALPEEIMRRLASLGEMEFTESTNANGTLGFVFDYRIRRVDPDGVVIPDSGNNQVSPKKLESIEYNFPSESIDEIGKQVGNMISTNGQVVVDKVVGMMMIFDLPDYLVNIKKYMEPLQVKYQGYALDQESKVDPMATREYRINRDVADDTILDGVKNALTEDGRAVVNPERNSVIVLDRKSNLAILDEFFKAFDSKPQQVLITAKLVEVLLDDYIGYGLQIFTQHEADGWENGTVGASSQDSGANTVQGMFGQPTGFDPFFATFVNSRIDMRLEALANESRVETLAQPSSLVANRRTAKIDVGQEVPYLSQASGDSGSGGSTSAATVAFKDITISLEITPTILEDGLIRLEVLMSTREVIDSVAIEDNNTPVLSKRETESVLFVRDGETVAMGGLIRERSSTQENGLPFLKDIPFLGYLFKTQSKTVEKNDLVFFLRPQIVSMDARKRSAKVSNVAGTGLDLVRDLRPMTLGSDEGDAAGLRPKRYRTNKKASKPNWFKSSRPKKAADVKPGQ